MMDFLEWLVKLLGLILALLRPIRKLWRWLRRK